MTLFRLTALLMLTSALGAVQGCTSVARGVTQGVIAAQEEKEADPGVCLIQGPAFGGIAAEFQDDVGQADSNAVLMVHGIGVHTPGYSGRFQRRLATALELDVLYEPPKEFRVLPSPQGISMGVAEQPLATLRVNRWTNNDETRELLFYELTWSAISEPLKRTLDYDTSTDFSQFRSGLNQSLKQFFNTRVSDSLIYTGSQQKNILHAVTQSMCWVYTNTWDSLPAGGDQACNSANLESLRRFAANLETLDIAIVTHSLGSRIVIDALQYIAARAQTLQMSDTEFMTELLQSQQVPIYMLANQLPLLQLGFSVPEVTGMVDDYCKPTGDLYNERLFSEVEVVAFSDPNDLLSYAIPPNFAARYLDSRICPVIVNVLVNVAQPVGVPVLGSVVNPMTAHLDYETDQRVIDIIARGVRRGDAGNDVPEGCIWTETRETKVARKNVN